MGSRMIIIMGVWVVTRIKKTKLLYSTIMSKAVVKTIKFRQIKMHCLPRADSVSSKNKRGKIILIRKSKMEIKGTIISHRKVANLAIVGNLRKT